MSKREMETIVANLLLKQRRFKRLGTDLSPNELALLSRLLQRLGYTKMTRNKPIVYSRKELMSWLDSSGKFHSIEGRDNHHSWAVNKGHISLGNINDMFKKGWMRVYHHNNNVYSHNDITHPNQHQRNALKELAIENKMDSVIHQKGDKEHTLWSNSDKLSRNINIPLEDSPQEIPLKRYARLQKDRDKAHPLIEGFPIAHLLYKMANDPKNGKNIRSISKHIYKTGDSSALWGLHDLIQNPDEHKYGHEHPVIKAGYNLLNAADKIGLDAKTHEAMTHLANQEKEGLPSELTSGVWAYTPEYQAERAYIGLNKNLNTEYYNTHLNNLRQEVKRRRPETPDDMIDESIKRHAHRARYKWAQTNNDIRNDLVDYYHEDALKNPKEISEYLRDETKASRYKRKPKRYSLANKSNFIGSLLKVSSPEHKLFVQRTKELARKMGAKQTKEYPALHDTPQQSVPGVAMAIYGHIQPDSAHALGSWVNGLLPNGPGYAVFHARPTGPDTLYRLRMEGSGYDARAKLDRSGIQSRVFVPHKKGLDVLIPDKGNKMGPLVQQFARQQKTPIEASPGHLLTVGSQDQGQARSTFRNKIVKNESNPQTLNKLSRRRHLIKTYAISIGPNKQKIPIPPYSKSGTKTLPDEVNEPKENPKPSLRDKFKDAYAAYEKIYGPLEEPKTNTPVSGPKPIEKEEDPLPYDVISKPKKVNGKLVYKPIGGPDKEGVYNNFTWNWEKNNEDTPTVKPKESTKPKPRTKTQSTNSQVNTPTGKPSQSKWSNKYYSDAYYGNYNPAPKPSHVSDEQWKKIRTWAAEHSANNAQRLAKKLGTSTLDAHNILLDAIMQTAGEMLRRGKRTSGIGKLNGKKIRINVGHRTFTRYGRRFKITIPHSLIYPKTTPIVNTDHNLIIKSKYSRRRSILNARY